MDRTKQTANSKGSYSNPDLSKAQRGLFENAVTAYKNGDLRTLRTIGEMVYEPVLPDTEQDAMAYVSQKRAI